MQIDRNKRSFLLLIIINRKYSGDIHFDVTQLICLFFAIFSNTTEAVYLNHALYFGVYQLPIHKRLIPNQKAL